MDVTVSEIGVEAIEYHLDSQTVRTQFDQTQTPASLAVVATLAEVMDADPGDLDPLHGSVDPEALDAISRVRHKPSGDIHVSFTHEDHEITVASYGMVTISPGHEPSTEHPDWRDDYDN